MTNNSPNVLYLGRTNHDLQTAVVNDLSEFYKLDVATDDVAAMPYVLCVNCLQHQSISFVRKDLAFFAKMMILVPTGQRKTVVLMDADFLSAEAQAALRRSIEVNNHTTRFIITTKRFENIQDPILSRFKTVDVSRFFFEPPISRCTSSLQMSSISALMKEIDALVARGESRGIRDNDYKEKSSYAIDLKREGCRSDQLVALYATLVRRHE